MKTGEPFSCVVVSYDKKRKTGGKIIHYGEAILYNAREQQAATRGQTRVEELREQLRNRRNPHHSKHFTRNIQLLINGHPVGDPVKLHPPLVVRFNDQSVIG